MGKARSFMMALFPDRESAELGYSALCERGYSGAEVDVLMTDYAKNRYFPNGSGMTALGAKAAEKSSDGADLLAQREIPEDSARQFGDGLRRGLILMLVKPHTEQDAWYLDNAWRINRAQNVYC